MLRRAENIRNSKGQVVKELANDDPTNEMPGSPPKVNSFGAVIKRKLLQFKTHSDALRRSKSLNEQTTELEVREDSEQIQIKPRRRHSRSLTDVSMAEVQTQELTVIRKSFSGPSRQQTLVSVSKGVPGPEAERFPPTIGNIRVPQLLQQGTPMTKVSSKKHKNFVFRLDADLGQIVWESKKQKIIPIENIKELRSGDDARYYREQFQFSQDYQDRWLTVIYLLDGNYKTLHLIAATKDVFYMWNRTLRTLHAIRLELMRGLGNVEMRQSLWEKHYWKGADEERDQKLTFDEVEKLCKRLNINSNDEDLLRMFKQADSQNRQFLDFHDFRRFVRLLKARPEIDRLYKKFRADNNGIFDLAVFETFMLEEQQSSLSSLELRKIFYKYSTPKAPVPTIQCSSDIMTIDAFTSFLLSPDNSVFADQHKDTWQDMTRPLSEYFISSSHNTYLVGHQLVGVSTIEGYIRALLHSCRSVELDIYDGEQEPMIFHGKTFTSKVSLREVCQTIAKYGFVASPYPIIISAEVHCALASQDMIAEIMTTEFGDALVRLPVELDADGVSIGVIRERIEQLPSPAELKGKILLKAKNVTFVPYAVGNDVVSTSTDPSSASDSDAFFDVIKESSHVTARAERETEHGKQARRQSDSTVKDQLTRARTKILKRVKSVGKSTSTPAPLPQSPPSTCSSVSSNMDLTPVPTGFKLPVKSSKSHGSPDVGERLSKPKMSFQLLALLVYTVGVKCRGINKKEEYAPEHMFSLSENMANKMLRFGMWDLIKHTKTHLVRIYPKGTRLNSTNYEPHRFWAAGGQLVAINWQTFDLGYMINHAMFQRNGRSGYVLKPDAIRLAEKELLMKRTNHSFNVTIVSAQQLPRPKDASGHEVPERAIVDPYVEVTLYVPDWPAILDGKIEDNGSGKEFSEANGHHRSITSAPVAPSNLLPIGLSGGAGSTPNRALSSRTSVVRRNGWNPVWEENLRIPFDCVGDMMDLIFVRFVIRQEDKETLEPLAVYCASLGSLQHGYRHLPLHDSQLSQYLFSTLFVRIDITPLDSS